MTSAAKPILLVVVNAHFDPIWRRCWDRHFTFNGDVFVSYADLEEYYVLDNLDLARRHPDYKFEIESVAVMRKFLERHPDQLAELRQLARAGRFAVNGSGDNIIDVNMVLGESIARNYVSGLLWVEDTFGAKPRLAVRNDAFGNSAQLPQILRGCEIAWATGMSYTPVNGIYWRGLDDSAVLTSSLPCVSWSGHWAKYPPCPACRGTGKGASPGATCDKCHGRAIDLTDLARLPRDIDSQALARFGAGMVMNTNEELLPNPGLPAWAKAAQADYDVRFALIEDALPFIQPWLERVDDPPEQEVHPSPELNPNNSGCLVTRIKTKQTCRRQEYALLAAEGLSVCAALSGAPYPQAALSDAWRKLLFTMFHDAITATHVDPAYVELQEMWRDIDAATGRIREAACAALVKPEPGTLSVINPAGQPATQIATCELPGGLENVALTDASGRAVPIIGARSTTAGGVEVDFVAEQVPALSSRVYHIRKTGAGPSPVASLSKPVIENERFRVNADERGLLSVYDKALGVNILEADEYRPGELILEHDEGSPWATLSPDHRRLPLSPHTRLASAEKGAAFERLVFDVTAPDGAGYALCCVQARVSVTLAAGLERVDFQARVQWSAHNHRLRVAMPVPRRGRHFYGIPYGTLERQPYAPTYTWFGANGDWPAINWAGVQAHKLSVALLNKGLPSYRMEPGKTQGEVILLSVLRSPCVPTYLHHSYLMTDWDGMRDEGDHDFSYAVTAYPEPFADSRVVLDAEGYNAGLLAVPGRAQLPPLPAVQSDNVRLASVKWAEKGRALILRCCEFRGRAGSACVTLPEGVRGAAKVNLLERQGEPLAVENGRAQFRVRPWEIATLRLEVD